MKPVIIHSQARAELDQAMLYYERQKPGLGLDLQAEVPPRVKVRYLNPRSQPWPGRVARRFLSGRLGVLLQVAYLPVQGNNWV